MRERLGEHVALTYRDPDGQVARRFPWNPNGSLLAAAGLTNRAGNVLAMMPHPERAVLEAQVPPSLRATGPAALEHEGPGLLLFRSLVEAGLADQQKRNQQLNLNRQLVVPPVVSYKQRRLKDPTMLLNRHNPWQTILI